MNNRTIRTGAIFAFAAAMLLNVFAASGATQAPSPKPAIKLGTPFVDNAILQRQMKVPVWGWSKPGVKIGVQFAGQSKSAVAGENGKWMLKLDELKANAKPAEMIISDNAGKKVVLKNILVGEVWLASGQSNMQWPANKCVVGRKLIPDILARVKEGKEPMPIIREGKVTDVFSSLYPTEHAQGAWSDKWQDFSAISFAFAYDIAKELKVPVGIVNCAFSTTQIQAWAPREGFAGGEDGYTKAIYKRILESDLKAPEHKKAWSAYYQSLRDWARECAQRVEKKLPVTRPPSAPGKLRGNRDISWMYNGKIHPMVPYAIRGGIWNQGYANQNDGIFYRNNLHSLVRGWRKVWGKPDLPVYFHQFYCPGKKFDDGVTLNDTAEMRLGTWLASKEIPNVAMASQIDITGGVHYYNKAVPGQRLARHALKNQYGKKIIANGPTYKGYTVKGDKLILELNYAAGLVAGQSMTDKGGFADPVVIKNGAPQVKLFHIADKDRVWHPASVKIVGETIVLTAPGLKAPCGVSYGCNGVGPQLSIYNKAMLPLTPFIYYQNKLVTSTNWPMDHIKIAGKVIDPTTYGAQEVYRKLTLLSPQFRNGGVLQAGAPTRFYGGALPGSVVKVTFNGSTQSVTVGPNKSDWEATFPALPASIKPKTLHVTCKLDGVLVHQRKISGLAMGDLWYVSLQDPAMPRAKGWPKSPVATGNVRMLMAFAMKRTHGLPDRFKLSSSGTQNSRFFSTWAAGEGVAKVLGDRIHAKTGKPVGIIIMNSLGDLPIKAWVGYDSLKQCPAWKGDADELYSRYAPDPKVYASNAETYISDWKAYWKKVATDPTFEAGAMPRFPGSKSVKTPATMTYNMLICAFGPGNFKGVICLTPKSFLGEDKGAGFGTRFSIMANSWKDTFAYGKQVLDPHFFYTVPSKTLAPKITTPTGIKGKATAYEMNQWLTTYDPKTRKTAVGEDVVKFLESAVNAVYK
ncbi:MAG: hypothetical protein HN350_01570 [Phycisphaerales bacterium]|jgi:hypothetical protein|nr:hypothetical protein [Phycisphaerales bacterium]